MSGQARNMKYEIWNMKYAIWYRIYDIWYMIYGIWYMVYGIWYMIYYIWYIRYHIWYMVYHMSYIVYDIWHLDVLHQQLNKRWTAPECLARKWRHRDVLHQKQKQSGQIQICLQIIKSNNVFVAPQPKTGETIQIVCKQVPT